MKVLDDLIERGHDLAYQIPGDQYPSAQYVQQYGTNLPHVAGYRRLRLDEIRELSFTITADKTPRSYACWETLAAYEEQLYYDLASRNWLPISAINQTLQSDPNDPLGSFVEQVVTLV